MVPNFGDPHCPGASTSHNVSIAAKASHSGSHWAAHAQIRLSCSYDTNRWMELEKKVGQLQL